MALVWAGVDCGKAHHHCVVVGDDGRRLLSRRVANGESELLALIAEVTALADSVTWAVDLPDGGAALLIGLLIGRGQELAYLPGRAVHRAAGTYRGEGKTDAGTLRSSPTRPGCAGTWPRCDPATRSPPS